MRGRERHRFRAGIPNEKMKCIHCWAACDEISFDGCSAGGVTRAAPLCSSTCTGCSGGQGRWRQAGMRLERQAVLAQGGLALLVRLGQRPEDVGARHDAHAHAVVVNHGHAVELVLRQGEGEGGVAGGAARWVGGAACWRDASQRSGSRREAAAQRPNLQVPTAPPPLPLPHLGHADGRVRHLAGGLEGNGGRGHHVLQRKVGGL